MEAIPTSNNVEIISRKLIASDISLLSSGHGNTASVQGPTLLYAILDGNFCYLVAESYNAPSKKSVSLLFRQFYKQEASSRDVKIF